MQVAELTALDSVALFLICEYSHTDSTGPSQGEAGLAQISGDG